MTVDEKASTASRSTSAAHFPGVNNTTVWSDPESGSQIEFDSFVHLARTAERGLFDFFFLAEGLRLREHRGRIHDLDVVGRPDTFTVLAALAAVTDRLGLTGTINTTFNEPFEVAQAIRHPRPPVRRPRRLEHGHLVGRVHRRELPPRRIPRPLRPLQAGRGVRHRRARVLGQLGTRRRGRRSETAESTSTPAAFVSSNTGDRSSTCAVSPPCRARRRAIPCCCRRVTPPTVGRSCAKYADAAFTLHSDLGGRPGLLRRRQGPRRVVRPRSRPAQGVSGGHVRARRHRRGGGRQGPPYPASAGDAADRDRDARTGLAARPVRLRPRRPAARCRTGRRSDHHPGAGAPRRPQGRRRRMARARRRRATCPSANWSSPSPAASSSSAPPRRSPTRSTCTCSPTPATGSSWCRT